MKAGQDEEKDYGWLRDLLADEVALRRSFREIPDLANGLTDNAAFLETLLSERGALMGLIRKELLPRYGEQDYAGPDIFLCGHFPGHDGAAQEAPRDSRGVRVASLLAHTVEAEAVFRKHPKLAAIAAGNNAYVEQLKLLRPEAYRALLVKAGEVFRQDPEMRGLIAAATAASPEEIAFTAEGGNKPSRAETLGQQLGDVARNGKVTAIKALLANERFDPNRHDIGGSTALMWAAWNGKVTAVKALLGDRRVDPNRQDIGGGTALMWAAWNGNVAAVKALLGDRRVDPNRQDTGGRTALIWAARNGNVKAVKALLGDRRIDPNRQDTDGRTVFDIAMACGYHSIRRMLQTTRARNGPVIGGP